jgi:MinD-like ATPase involved in chromosome partitioning or flagellar assembly
MKTITFYSYKGGTGRTMALANAAVYLAQLGFKVVALDFDLEAPGLHYKFSTKPDGPPLRVEKGVVDFVTQFMVDGQVSSPLKEFVLDVSIPGVGGQLIQLIPAGQGPSNDYWLKLSRIDWHRLFYSEGAKGVQVFMELKARIEEELKPDFLLVDSRTGITEMGGIATTLFADKIICLVLPTLENLQGARAVLRSLKHSRRDSGHPDLEITIAVSRLPQIKDSEEEQDITQRILTEIRVAADDLRDTLSCQSVFVLHSETALQLQEALRVGSGITPDDSILLRDYLRLFASFVPKESIEPKVRDLIAKAKERMWDTPDAAVKEMEALAESFGHPEIYRELLRFYLVRNVSHISILKRSQRLWELTGDSYDPKLWQALSQSFDPDVLYPRARVGWSPNLDFVRAVWQASGHKDPQFALKLAHTFSMEDRDSAAADILLDVMKSFDATALIASRCISYLEFANRSSEADSLIQQLKAKLQAEPRFLEAWARHLLKPNTKDLASITELTSSPLAEALIKINSSLAARIYYKAGNKDYATELATSALHGLLRGEYSSVDLIEIAEFYFEVGTLDEFEKITDKKVPPRILREVLDKFDTRRRRAKLRSSSITDLM